MAAIRITNGFLNLSGKGDLLTGILIEGEITKNDSIVYDSEIQVPIIDIEFDKTTFPGTTHIRLTVPRDIGIVWNKIYGDIIKTKRNSI